MDFRTRFYTQLTNTAVSAADRELIAEHLGISEDEIRQIPHDQAPVVPL